MGTLLIHVRGGFVTLRLPKCSTIRYVLLQAERELRERRTIAEALPKLLHARMDRETA